MNKERNVQFFNLKRIFYLGLKGIKDKYMNIGIKVKSNFGIFDAHYQLSRFTR